MAGNLKQKLANLENQLKRAIADYQNLEKRGALERETFIKIANSNLISNLLPGLDILEKSAFHSQDSGVKMALEQFRQALKLEGLEEIDPKTGDPFDPRFQECVETVESQDQTPNTVSEVVSKGFVFRDGIVLRPAKVKVFKSNTISQ